MMPATVSRPDDDHHEHEHRAEVGLEEHEPDRHRYECEDRGQAPRVELAAVLVAVAGERHDDPELGELRRLEREATGELEPRLVALDVRAERREHREQQGDRREVGEHRVVAQSPVVDRDHREHRHDAEPDEQRLALDEVELVAGNAVVRGRPDHHETDAADREHCADEQEVEVAHWSDVEASRRGSAACRRSRGGSSTSVALLDRRGRRSAPARDRGCR